MFIPAELADLLARPATTREDRALPLVTEDVILFESSLAPPSSEPRTRWPLYLASSLGVLLAVWLLGRWGSLLVPARGWLALSGLVGCALLFFWVGTDHAAARLNLNLLVFNPLWLLPAVWKGSWKFALGGVSAFAALALAMMVLPPRQYTADVLAAFVPLNLAAAYVVFKFRPRPAGPPGAPAISDQ
jgi:hypothetical protein